VRVVVDHDLCEGNAECVKLAPGIFTVGDDDRARLLVETPPAARRAAVERAVHRCPRQAIALRED